MLVVEKTNITKCKFASNTWISICKLIFGISKGSEEGYRLWIMFCQTNKLFNAEFCKNIWNDNILIDLNDILDDDEVVSILSDDYDFLDEEDVPDLPNGW